MILDKEFNSSFDTVWSDFDQYMIDTALEQLSKLPKRIFADLWFVKQQNNRNISLGTVVSFNDCVVTIVGLNAVKINEILYFSNNVSGLALSLDKNGVVKALLFKGIRSIRSGDSVRSSGFVFRVGVGFSLLGRVINPIGTPLDGGSSSFFTEFRDVEMKAPGVITRKKVSAPMLTGIKMIDTLVPIGRGQRELILGDRRTGKTTIAVDTILNQRFTNFTLKSSLFCVYVSIGKRMSEVSEIYFTLKRNNALTYSILVIARSSDPVSLQFLAPYAACSMAEYFTYRNLHSLIIFDDLTRHADAYRQMSLLLQRPAGREAYPGDIFYLHSRLLERSANLRFKSGGGSLTALPIIETLQGDVSAYIPTNVISITDGQIYLDATRHQQGFRPAVDPGLSVSRVGSAAQSALIKKVSSGLKLKLAQYRELLLFVQFSSEVDEETERSMLEGKILTTLLLQKANEPVDPFNIVLLLFASSTPYFLNTIMKLIGDNADMLLNYFDDFCYFVNNSGLADPFRILAYKTKASSEQINYCLTFLNTLQLQHFSFHFIRKFFARISSKLEPVYYSSFLQLQSTSYYNLISKLFSQLPNYTFWMADDGLFEKIFISNEKLTNIFVSKNSSGAKLQLYLAKLGIYSANSYYLHLIKLLIEVGFLNKETVSSFVRFTKDGNISCVIVPNFGTLLVVKTETSSLKAVWRNVTFKPVSNKNEEVDFLLSNKDLAAISYDFQFLNVSMSETDF